MVKTIARSALCLRCTNCLRQNCTGDFTPDLIKSKQKIMQGSDVHIKQWIIWRRTEWLNKDAMSGESKCGLLQWTSWWRSTPPHPTQFGTPSNVAVSNMQTSTSWKAKTRKPLWWLTKKATCTRSKKCDQAGWSSVELALQHCSADGLERRPSTLAKEERNGYSLGRQRSRLPHEYALCWRCAPVCFFERAASKSAVRLQVQHRKGGTQNTSRKDEKFSPTNARTVGKKSRLTTSKSKC